MYVDLRCGDDVETVVDRYLTFDNEDLGQQCIAEMRAEVSSWKHNAEPSTAEQAKIEQAKKGVSSRKTVKKPKA